MQVGAAAVFETFIREQARAYRDLRPVLVGFRRVANGLSLEPLSVLTLVSGGHRIHGATLRDIELYEKFRTVVGNPPAD